MKTTSRTRIALAAIVPVLTLAVTGCGSNDDSAEPAPTRTQADINAAYVALWHEFVTDSQKMSKDAKAMTEATPEAFNAVYRWDENSLASVTEVTASSLCIVSRDDVTLSVSTDANGKTSLLMGEGTECSYEKDDAAIAISMGTDGYSAKITKGKDLLAPEEEPSTEVVG